jgi:hypothetical protein
MVRVVVADWMVGIAVGGGMVGRIGKVVVAVVAAGGKNVISC